MTWFLHWGEHVNWTPLAFLAATAALLLLTRLFTAWFWWHRLRKAQYASDSQAQEIEFEKITAECLNPSTHPVPMIVSHLYAIAYLLFAAMALWGTVSTAWWVPLFSLWPPSSSTYPSVRQWLASTNSKGFECTQHLPGASPHETTFRAIRP
jgi:hypothetical protein